MGEKPRLPSIKDLLEGGPGLIDYTAPPSTTQQGQNSNRFIHRRHASEHTASGFHQQPPMPPSNTYSSIPNTSQTLPLDMQSLSLEKKVPKESAFTVVAKNSRTRSHSRSYSDLSSYPYPRLETILQPIPSKQSEEEEEPEEEEEEVIAEEGENETVTPTESSRYTCPYCNKGFTRPSSLRTHIYSHTGEKPFECTEPCCGRKFSVPSNLRRHLKIHKSNKIALFLPKNIN